jgi:choline kinase
VIILPAGLGSRLGDLTARRPKALLDLGGVSLLERSIEFAARLGADDIIIVGGYHIERCRLSTARAELYRYTHAAGVTESGVCAQIAAACDDPAARWLRGD